MATPNHKPIKPTVHASERMLLRRISLNQLCVTVRSPTRTLAGNTTYTQRLEKDFPNGKYLVAIIEECESEIKVVTTYWR